MKEKHLHFTLLLIRSLLAICIAMVVAMLNLALNFWLQAEVLQPAEDTLVSTLSFLLPVLLGGIGAGASIAWPAMRMALLHGLLFVGLYLLMFIPGWFQAEEIGAGLISALLLGSLLLAVVGAGLGFLIRRRIQQLRR